jgi:hypothetical protein
MKVWKATPSSTTKSTSMHMHLLMKEVEEKDDLFVFLPSAILLFTTI